MSDLTKKTADLTKNVEEQIQPFQSRPREVEALFYDGTNIDKVKEFTVGDIDISPVNEKTLTIFAGTVNAKVLNPGTWIVKESDMFTLYEDADFTRLFEKVEKKSE